MALFETLILPILFLIGSLSLVAMKRATKTLGRIELKREIYRRYRLFFIYFFLKKIFKKEEWENLYFLISFSQHILRMLYASTAFIYFINQGMAIYLAIISIVLIALICDFLIRFLTQVRPKLLLRLSAPISTFFMLLFSPITFCFLKAHQLIRRKRKRDEEGSEPTKVKNRILELVHETDLKELLEPMDRRLMTSLISFRERIAREIMVPRINLFSLPIDLTIHEAAIKFISEGYSRIPVYRESVDDIAGVILYKDVLKYYIEAFENQNPELLKTPLETLLTPILYTPETKKISHLLQEFRSKQIHIALVVDEYGGTEGIVTIEDILEEIVGEIADEHDILNEEVLYHSMPDGGYVVDAKMNILDIEKEMGIVIPSSPEYDTLGGYIFHKAGTIPQKGWRIHHDNFDLEVISSNERSIEKIWIVLPRIAT